MEKILEQMAAGCGEASSKFYGLVVGRVINLLDPMALGRVQVQLPFIDDVNLSPWARVAVPMAGAAHGTYFIPNLKDEVIVGFEHGERNAPYILGSLWNATAPPPIPSPVAQIRTIKTPIGNQVIFSEVPPTITIQTPQGQTIVMSPAGIQITTGTSMVSMTADGVTVAGAQINVTATASIDLTAPNVTVNGMAATNVQSAGVCKVEAPLVKIN